MSIEIKWTVEDPETGEKRYLLAEKFGGQWYFKIRMFRRDVWKKTEPTREMWEEVLDGLERRYQRREGVTDEDLAHVRKVLREMPVPRDLDERPPG
jgi:hypothetical protein